MKQCKSVRYLVELQTFQALLQAHLEVFLHAKQAGQLGMIGQAMVPLQQLLQFEAINVAVVDTNGTVALMLSLSCTPQIPWASFPKQKVRATPCLTTGTREVVERKPACQPKAGIVLPHHSESCCGQLGPVRVLPSPTVPANCSCKLGLLHTGAALPSKAA